MALFRTKTDEPAISIIVPFYNSEKYIGECLNSIIGGTKIPYEIICVDDGSTDGSADIVKRYCAENDTIKLISFPENKGLYLARLAGVKAARGRYIGFVDSDDYVSPRYFDKLYHAIQRSGADISVGQVVNIDLKGVKYVQTRCAKFPYLNGESRGELYEMYWRQSGRCYHWHVVWNKLYRRELWTNAMSVLEQQTEHLVMLEDFIFSSVVLSAAKKYAVNTSARYFYIARTDASISASCKLEKIRSSISNMRRAFEFVEEFLRNNSKLERYIPFLEQWRERYGRYWKRNVGGSKLSEADKQNCLNSLAEMTGVEIGDVTAEDEFYYKIATILKMQGDRLWILKKHAKA